MKISKKCLIGAQSSESFALEIFINSSKGMRFLKGGIVEVALAASKSVMGVGSASGIDGICLGFESLALADMVEVFQL